MSALALRVPVVVDYDPLRDKTYAEADLGPDVAAFLAWLDLGGMAAGTIDQYEKALAVACRMYPRVPLQLLTDEHLSQVFKTFPIKGRRSRVAAYRTFFKWARQTRRIGENPMELIPNIRQPPRKLHDVFSDAEIDQLLSLDVVDAAPLGLLLEAGLRRSEAMALQTKHCTPETRSVRVLNGKGGKDRVVSQSGRLTTLLADLVLLEDLQPNQHIFYGLRANYQGYRVYRRRLREKPIGETRFYRWWYDCLDQAGVRPRNPHEARHTFATRWKRRGLPAEDLAVVMGHESVRTTIDEYFHIDPSDVGDRMRAIEAAEALSE